MYYLRDMLTVLLAVTLAGPPSIAPPGVAFHDALSDAKQAIYDGDYERAMQNLEALGKRLRVGEDPGDLLSSEALLFLGDVQFVLGDTKRARETFRRVLLDHPDQPISPYDHGEDVRALFALVREEVQRERAAQLPIEPPVLPRPRRIPILYYAPFGAGQWSQGRRSAAALHTSVQGLLATGSLISLIVVDRANHLNNDRQRWSQRKVDTVRYGVQWPLTVGFYAAWGWSLADASRHRPSPTSVRLTRNGVEIQGRFQ